MPTRQLHRQHALSEWPPNLPAKVRLLDLHRPEGESYVLTVASGSRSLVFWAWLASKSIGAVGRFEPAEQAVPVDARGHGACPCPMNDKLRLPRSAQAGAGRARGRECRRLGAQATGEMT